MNLNNYQTWCEVAGTTFTGLDDEAVYRIMKECYFKRFQIVSEDFKTILKEYKIENDTTKN